jgi:hypothetical protein
MRPRCCAGTKQEAERAGFFLCGLARTLGEWQLALPAGPAAARRAAAAFVEFAALPAADGATCVCAPMSPAEKVRPGARGRACESAVTQLHTTWSSLSNVALCLSQVLLLHMDPAPAWFIAGSPSRREMWQLKEARGRTTACKPTVTYFKGRPWSCLGCQPALRALHPAGARRAAGGAAAGGGLVHRLRGRGRARERIQRAAGGGGVRGGRAGAGLPVRRRAGGAPAPPAPGPWLCARESGAVLARAWAAGPPL